MNENLVVSVTRALFVKFRTALTQDHTAVVENLHKGTQATLTVEEHVHKRIDEEYPNDEYIGRCFRLKKFNNGTVEIGEIRRVKRFI